MDSTLRCNSLTCRVSLKDSAVVTTCSHVFCLSCADSPSFLSASDPTNAHNGGGRCCPACKSRLDNPDDAVVTNLCPSEDYKTSVLSGLSPTVIMECAGRGLAFYAYQSTQEIFYQEHVGKSMNNKFQALKHRFDNLEHEKGSEIAQLTEQLQTADQEIRDIRRTNAEMLESFKKMKREKEQLYQVYTQIKAKQLAGDIEFAAEEDAVQALQGNGRIAGFEPYDQRGGGYALHSRAGSGCSGGRRTAQEMAHGGFQNGRQSSRSAPMPATPSTHRQQLQHPSGYVGRGSSILSGAGYPGMRVDQLQQVPPFRQPLGNIDQNAYNDRGGTGYGMSAGMKVGRQPSGQGGRSGMNNGRPRVGGGLGMR